MPDILRVQMIDDQTELSAGSKLVPLVGILWHGSNYYATIMNPSDENGIATLSRDDLYMRYHEDQQVFPMDYKVILNECDNRVKITLLGGSEFTGVLERLKSYPLARRDVIDAYGVSRNELFETAHTFIDLEQESINSPKKDFVLHLKKTS